MYGLDRLERLARYYPLAGPSEFLQQLRIDLEQFLANSQPDDDLTALVAELRGD